MKRSMAERLHDSSTPEPNTGCWLWTLKMDRDGYGRAKVRGHDTPASRLAWEAATGEPPPADKLVCHTCDFPPCVNPDHLFLGTHRDNILDCHAKGRSAPQRGQHNPTSRLSDAAVTDVRARRAAGESLRAIAEDLGVNISTVCVAARGASWRHVGALAAPAARCGCGRSLKRHVGRPVYDRCWVCRGDEGAEDSP